MNQHSPIPTGADGVAAAFMGIEVPGSPFLNDTRIDRINSGRYEGQEIAAALHVIGSDDRVIELGAGIGLVGAVIARNARPAAQMAFEANPALIPHIEALYARNKIKSKITLRNEVLLTQPESPEYVTFHIRNSFLGSSLVQDPRRQSTPVEVPTASYDALRSRFRPSVLVMDIEGGELDFLEHADLTGLRALVIEFHPGLYGVSGMRHCKSILRDAGFRKIEDYSTRTVWACERAEDAAGT
ncbi:FkbM family methyltransferase [Marimonas arenosa]|uniref:FkbM family methyltransferase n=1 Tax=Marimonas arenosa TaxID=1795305 RepID=A0AAE3WGX2_9RHOB|nr:FkbM family methyltransferase [Marimonas arenosa]MDQ2091408.1 FkbM family methyltransferase [Marimonas arenosa]